MFVVYNGQRIAKRGEPGTPQAGTWVVLAPGYAVTGFTQDLVVEFDPSACQ
jgi:hypothetical protein